ncbi:hypothetical protein H4F49_19835 [Pectobacterium polaris]|nr:hypothetical protein [Pectobacterium polaris]
MSHMISLWHSHHARSGRSVAAALRTQAFWRKLCRFAVPSAFENAIVPLVTRLLAP